MHHTRIAENLQHIQKSIARLGDKYHRSPDSIQLLAVSKTKPVEFIRTAFEAGQTRFGENYLQEALSKMHSLEDLSIEWHFIGAIQSRKTRELAEHFDWVHSVDRFKIAQRLNQQRPAGLAPLNICLQVNISKEDAKSGLSIDEVEPIVDKIAPLPNLCLRGLMTIPAQSDRLDEQRDTFAHMRLMLQTLQKKHPTLDTLSMGMSGDMEAAIAEGSTLLRIGTAIFGAREPARV